LEPGRITRSQAGSGPPTEQTDVAAKAVDDDPADAVAFRFGQQRQGPHHGGENAAAIDVGDQQDRTVRGLGKAHVGDIVRSQIDLGRAAGAFDDNRVMVGSQPGV